MFLQTFLFDYIIFSKLFHYILSNKIITNLRSFLLPTLFFIQTALHIYYFIATKPSNYYQILKINRSFEIDELKLNYKSLKEKIEGSSIQGLKLKEAYNVIFFFYVLKYIKKL